MLQKCSSYLSIAIDIGPVSVNMSGAEALIVIGVIANVIQLVDFSTKILERVDGFSQDEKLLPESFRSLQIELPLLSNTLKRTSGRADLGELDEDTCKAINPIVSACRQKLEDLQNLFTKLIPRADASKAEVVWKAIRSLRKDKEVESIAASIAGFVQILTLHYAEAAGLSPAERFVVTDAVSRLAVSEKSSGQADLQRLLSSLPYADNAAFNSPIRERDKGCLHGTRLQLLDEIDAWSRDPDGKLIYWLSGMAGTGKSAVAQSVARKLADRKELGASFFFLRDAGDIGNASKLVTTLASQLCISFPEYRPALAKILQDDYTVFRQGLRSQWETLILGALKELKGKHLRTTPLFIVIDALDECASREDAQWLLQLFSETSVLDCPHLRFFLTSRPEERQRFRFQQRGHDLHSDFELHSIERGVVQDDITLYLHNQFAEAHTYKNLPQGWPSDADLQRLASNLASYSSMLQLFADLY
jgi:hypothetical protein